MHRQRFYDKFTESPSQIKLFFAASFIFFAILIVSISFVINYGYENSYIKKEINEKANNAISEKVKLLKHHLDIHKSSLEALSKNYIFRRYVESAQNNKTSNERTVTGLFQQVIASDQNVMQLRYIDKYGVEEIRLERSNPSPSYEIVPKNALQNKSERYYFKEVAKLSENSPMWVSDIDLNIENGKVQKPYVPTIRLALPVFVDGKFDGIIIMNLFMKDILKELAHSSIFTISLMDKEKEFLIGQYEANGKLLDFSWSRYSNKKVDIKSFAPEFFGNLSEASKFNSDALHLKMISNDVGLSQELVLFLKIKVSKIEEIKDNTLHKIIFILVIILLLSGPIGLLLALIPSKLASKVFTSQQKLDEKTLIFDEYLEAMNVNNIISKSDIHGKITYVNDNFCEVSGYTKEEVIGKPHSLLRDPEQKKEVFKILWLTIQGGKTWKGILRNKKKNGEFYYVDIAIMPIFSHQNQIIEYVAIRHDITELMTQRKNLLNIATKDSLTNVGNRYKLSYDINQHIVNNVAIIDIDKFSTINDFYGHKIGDEVIIKFAKLLIANLTNEFQLYRLHGDKFAIHNFTLDTARFSNFIVHLNQKMVESIINTDVRSFDIVTTSGISSTQNDVIISTAEIANKYAKKIHKKVLVYSKDLNIESQFEENIQWTEKVKKALNEDRIVVYYQPILNNKTNTIEKYEALVRLKDEKGEIISPYYFLNIAKSSNQYIDITKVVIKKSFEKFQNIMCEFSINLTVEDILNDELCDYLEEMILKYNIGKKLVIELVESEGIEQFEIVQRFINRLKSFGCKIAIDDFGTGYSNFEYLIKLQSNYIKIDGSMIKNINSDQNIKEIVKIIIDFAKKMNYQTIAEFVATQEIYDAILELGVDYAQGYHIGIPKEDLVNAI